MAKEIGIPKNTPKSVKKKDVAYDKKKGVKEGSKEDLMADKKMMRDYKSTKPSKRK